MMERKTIVIGTFENPVILSQKEHFDKINALKDCDIVIVGDLETTREEILKIDGGNLYVYGEIAGAGIETTLGDVFCQGNIVLGGDIKVNGNFTCTGNLNGRAYNIYVTEDCRIWELQNTYNCSCLGNFYSNSVNLCYNLEHGGNFVCDSGTRIYHQKKLF